MGRCLSGTGLGLAWLLGRLPALSQQGALNQTSFGGLGHVSPAGTAIGVWQQQSLGQAKLFWQTLGGRDSMCYNAQCSAMSSQPDWDVLEGSFQLLVRVQEWQEQNTGTMAPVAGQSQVLGTCSLGFSLRFVHQT